MNKKLTSEIEKAKNILGKWATGFSLELGNFHFPDSYYLKFNRGIFSLIFLDERGGKTVIFETDDYDIIRYECFKLLVGYCTSHYTFNANVKEKGEMKKRLKKEDHRRFLFEKRIEFMGLIDINYVSKLEEEIQSILAKAPYNDNR